MSGGKEENVKDRVRVHMTGFGTDSFSLDGEMPEEMATRFDRQHGRFLVMRYERDKRIAEAEARVIDAEANVEIAKAAVTRAKANAVRARAMSLKDVAKDYGIDLKNPGKPTPTAGKEK